MSYTYEYPRPSVTVDCVVFGYDHREQELSVLLIERGASPFEGFWALPGGFVDMQESADEAARRELCEETGVRDIYLEQLCTFSEPGRDPRGRVISVAYLALVNRAEHPATGGDDARQAAWHGLASLPELAFDHARILEVALERLRNKIRYAPIGFELLPARFTFRDIRRLYETILGRPLDASNFRRRLATTGLFEETEEREAEVSHRPARLLRLDEAVYRKLMREGYPFEF